MAAPGSFTSGSVLTAAEMNALPGGVVAYTEEIVNESVGTTYADFISVTFTAESGRLYLVHGFPGVVTPAAAQIYDLELVNSADARQNLVTFYVGGANEYVSPIVSHLYSGSGSTTLKLRHKVSTSTASVIGTSTRPRFLAVFDVGET